MPVRFQCFCQCRLLCCCSFCSSTKTHALHTSSVPSQKPWDNQTTTDSRILNTARCFKGDTGCNRFVAPKPLANVWYVMFDLHLMTNTFEETNSVLRKPLCNCVWLQKTPSPSAKLGFVSLWAYVSRFVTISRQLRMGPLVWWWSLAQTLKQSWKASQLNCKWVSPFCTRSP